MCKEKVRGEEGTLFYSLWISLFY